MKLYMMVLVVLACFVMPAMADVNQANQQGWPSLDGVKFVSGRSATQKDLKAGKAAFLMQHQGKSISQPLKLVIPQYAIHNAGAVKTKVIIIQAEEIKQNHLKVIGALDIKTGKHLAATLAEFTLLGVKRPE